MRLGGDPMGMHSDTIDLIRRPGFDQRRWDSGPKTIDRFIACGGLRRVDHVRAEQRTYERRNRFWRRAWPWVCIAGVLVLWALDHWRFA